jgi:dephospho-CoA kinase
MSQLIFGLTGFLGSGKDTVANYFEEKYGATTLGFSDMLRDILRRLHLDISRDTLVKISEGIREKFGEDIMAKAMSVDVKQNKSDFVVIDGVRRPEDIRYLSELPYFVLIEVYADDRVRYERLIKRSENTDDKGKTFEQFLADHKRSTEVTIRDTIKLAKERVNNNGTEENLSRQLDELYAKYSHKI